MAVRHMAFAAGTALTLLLAGGCGAKPTQSGHVPMAVCAHASQRAAAAGHTVPGSRWPEHRVGRQSPVGQAQVAVDAATHSAYALVPRNASSRHAQYLLECIDLRTGLVAKGPMFRAPDLTLALGRLWVYGGPGTRADAVVTQVDPRSLRVLRRIHLPGTQAAFPSIHLTVGPGHSVWAGSVHARGHELLVRIDARTGKVLSTVRLPAGLIVTDVATDPASAHLYASAAHAVRGGGDEGNVVLEYDASSGRLIAEASHGLVTYSVLGSALTAVPGSVWVSFRTGMLGLTLHLGQTDLALIAPTGPKEAQSPANGLFHWAMYAVTSYGAGSLWLANQGGIVACLDPATGKARATERVSQDHLIFQLLSADPASHTLYAADSHGMVAITPPAACWTR